MAILSVTPENPLLWAFLMQNYFRIRYIRKPLYYPWLYYPESTVLKSCSIRIRSNDGENHHLEDESDDVVDDVNESESEFEEPELKLQ